MLVDVIQPSRVNSNQCELVAGADVDAMAAYARGVALDMYAGWSVKTWMVTQTPIPRRLDDQGRGLSITKCRWSTGRTALHGSPQSRRWRGR